MSTVPTPLAQTRVHIRWMIRRDMPEVLAIEHASFEYPWCEEEFLRILRQRNCIGMVAELGDRIVGFMIYDLHRNKIHVLDFATHPELRRRGVGRQMVGKLAGKLSSQRRNRIALFVRETNLPAQFFFRIVGFRACNCLNNPQANTGQAHALGTWGGVLVPINARINEKLAVLAKDREQRRVPGLQRLLHFDALRGRDLAAHKDVGRLSLRGHYCWLIHGNVLAVGRRLHEFHVDDIQPVGRLGIRRGCKRRYAEHSEQDRTGKAHPHEELLFAWFSRNTRKAGKFTPRPHFTPYQTATTRKTPEAILSAATKAIQPPRPATWADCVTASCGSCKRSLKAFEAGKNVSL